MQLHFRTPKKSSRKIRLSHLWKKHLSQNSQGSTWRVGSDSFPQSFSPQKLFLQSCFGLLSMDFGLLKCDMDLDIIQVELYNTYLPSMYYIGWRGEYAICCIYKLYIYIYILPPFAPPKTRTYQLCLTVWSYFSSTCRFNLEVFGLFFLHNLKNIYRFFLT